MDCLSPPLSACRAQAAIIDVNLVAADRLVKRGHFGIVSGGNDQELREALFGLVSRPDDALPGDKPTDNDPTAIH